MKTTSLANRILENYEDRSKTFLTRRMITIIRLDGKGFSKFTKNLNKPFDDGFSEDMDSTAKYLCENIQGAKFAYTQSDEISVVLTDFDDLESQAWYDYSVQKMTSISASLATAKFNQLRLARVKSGVFVNETNEHPTLAFFDARVFQVPNLDEMVNTMIWRQQDCTRNSVSMAASAFFSHKLLEGKSSDMKQEMLFTEKGVNWNDYKPKYKRGSVIKRELVTVKGRNGEPVQRNQWLVDADTPIFTKDKDYLINLVKPKE